MNSVRRARALWLLLVVANLGWMYSAGTLSLHAVQSWNRLAASPLNLAAIGLASILLWIAGGFLLSRMPAVARAAQLHLPRAMGLLELAGAAGLILSVKSFNPAAHDLVDSSRWLMHAALALGVWIVLMPVLAVFAGRDGQPTLPEPKRPFYWLARDHVADRLARTYSLIAMAFHGIVLALLLNMLPPLAEWPGDGSASLHHRLFLFGCSALGGMAVAWLQYHWLRAMGLVHLGWVLVAIAGLAHAVSPSASWPITVLGSAAGLTYLPFVAGVICTTPSRQQWPAVLIVQALGPIAGLALWGLTLVAGDWVLPVLAIAGFAATCCFMKRELAEILTEFAFRIFWRPRAFGPGLFTMPTRGPLLVIGNHGAMLDPVWLAAYVPMRFRAMMLSTFMDKKAINWLVGGLFESIRVPDEGFRRTAPELDEAVAALRKGLCVMIFPEGWLRRKEEQPLRRFAQGLYRILRELPNTPVVSCWIEDGWGSFTSFKDGPPMKNKKMDFLTVIRMGFGEPEIVGPEVLVDDRATRRYFMQRVLHARTHLGLPAHPMPGEPSTPEAAE